MNQRINAFSSILMLTLLFVSCNNKTEAIGEHDLLVGTYTGLIYSSDFEGSLGSHLELTIVKTFQTKFTFYLVFRGSNDVIEIPGVEFISNADEISYNRKDVDSDFEIEGSFLKDGSSGEIVIKAQNTSLKGEIVKR